MLLKPTRLASLILVAALSACSGSGGSTPPANAHPITITQQPTTAVAAADGSLTYTVAAQSDIALSYQWLVNGHAVSGATGATFVLPAPDLGDGTEQITVAVSNASTSVVSNAVSVSAPTTPANGLSVVAGRIGGPGYVDGSASATRLGLSDVGSTGNQLAVDGAGNLLIADTSNFVVRSVTPAGVSSTVAGIAGHWGTTDGPAASALFSGTLGVATDATGNIYVGSYHSIRKITPAGVVSTVAGTESTLRDVAGNGTAAGFEDIIGFTADPAGNVYVSEFDGPIRKITPAGVVTTFVASQVGGQASYQALSFGADGNLYAFDSAQQQVDRISATGVVTVMARNVQDGTPAQAPFVQQSPIVAGPNGAVTVFSPGYQSSDGSTTTTFPSMMVHVAADGTFTTVTTDLPAGDHFGGAVAFGTGFAVMDQMRNVVYTVDASGKSTLFAGHPANAGSVDGRGSAARFNGPTKAVRDAAGNTYVLEQPLYGNVSVVRKIAADGTASTVFTRDETRLTSIAVSAQGQLYGMEYEQLERLNADNTTTIIVNAQQLKDSIGSNEIYDGLQDVAVSPAGNFIVCAQEGLFSVTAAGAITSLNTLSGCSAVATTPSGKVYEVQQVYGGSTATDATLVFDASTPGTPTLLAGHGVGDADGTGGAAAFGDINGYAAAGVGVRGMLSLASDENGTLYMIDPTNHAVRMITPAGVVTTIAGGPTTLSQVVTGAAAGLNYPAGIVPVPGTGGKQLLITDWVESSLLLLQRP